MNKVNSFGDQQKRLWTTDQEGVCQNKLGKGFSYVKTIHLKLCEIQSVHVIIELKALDINLSNTSPLTWCTSTYA